MLPDRMEILSFFNLLYFLNLNLLIFLVHFFFAINENFTSPISIIFPTTSCPGTVGNDGGIPISCQSPSIP